MTMRVPFLHQRVAPVLTAAAALALFAPFGAQAQFGGPPPAPRGPAKTIAPIDLTGYWVSIVTEDWRFRMITPPKGDTEGVPLNPAGTRAAAAWDPAKDEAAGEQCKSYGAPAIMRVPGRFHITWWTTTRSRSRPTPARRRDCCISARRRRRRKRRVCKAIPRPSGCSHWAAPPGAAAKDNRVESRSAAVP